MMDQSEISPTIIEKMSTSIFLGSGCEELNQFVYASQLYGTFFCVYGVFHTQSSSADSIQIEKIQLNILNYKGILNIGLTDAYYDWDKHYIVLNLKALQDPNKIVDVDFHGRNLSVSNGDELKMVRSLKHMSATPGDTDKNYVFDAEFYGRDGVLKYPKVRYDELKEAQIKANLTNPVNHDYIQEQGNDNTSSLNDFQEWAPGRRCVPTTMIIRY